MQLGFLREFVEGPGTALDAVPSAGEGWAMELRRRAACLHSVSVGCDARLLSFLLQHPTAAEELEAAFGSRGSQSERARRLVEILYPSLLLGEPQVRER